MPDRHRRTWAKVITWRMLMLITNTLIGWAVTGNIAAGLAIGASTLIVNSVIYILHERLWNHFRWGQT
jgi:uncharacterized membrane protein